MIKATSWMLGIALASGASFTAEGAGAAECANVSASRDALRASFQCNVDLRLAQRAPVLLVPGTALEPDENSA